MTEAEARDQLRDILAALEVRRGDTVYLGIDMGHVPLPGYSAELTRDAIRAREEKWCAFVLQVLREALGPEGTLLVATFTYSYAGQSVPFVLEESPSEVGPFTEYFRRQPDTIRSLHPLHSISGVGRHAHAILDNVGKAEYGAMSPYARLGEYGTKLLCLGAPLAASITYVHHLEQTYGINHRYTKAINTPVYRNGERVPGPWLCFMRYLGVATMPRHEHIEERLRAEGVLREATIDAHPMQCVDVHDVDRIGYAMLVENPCAFLERSVEVRLDESEVAAAPVADSVVRFVLGR